MPAEAGCAFFSSAKAFAFALGFFGLSEFFQDSRQLIVRARIFRIQFCCLAQ